MIQNMKMFYCQLVRTALWIANLYTLKFYLLNYLRKALQSSKYEFRRFFSFRTFQYCCRTIVSFHLSEDKGKNLWTLYRMGTALSQLQSRVKRSASSKKVTISPKLNLIFAQEGSFLVRLELHRLTLPKNRCTIPAQTLVHNFTPRDYHSHTSDSISTVSLVVTMCK